MSEIGQLWLVWSFWGNHKGVWNFGSIHTSVWSNDGITEASFSASISFASFEAIRYVHQIICPTFHLMNTLHWFKFQSFVHISSSEVVLIVAKFSPASIILKTVSSTALLCGPWFIRIIDEGIFDDCLFIYNLENLFWSIGIVCSSLESKYSYLSNNRTVRNKHTGWNLSPISINVQDGINIQGETYFSPNNHTGRYDKLH